MSWICKYCSTNNEDGDSKCIVCDNARTYSYTRTLTAKCVQDLRLSGDVVIPEEYNVIGEAAFKNRSDITSVRLHSGMSKIMKEAFSGCTNLREVYCEAKLNSIGPKAFYDCKSLTASKRPTAKVVQDDAFGMTPIIPPAPPRTSTPEIRPYSYEREEKTTTPTEDSGKKGFKWFARLLIAGAIIAASVAILNGIFHIF